jgi:hypothetical protein
MIAVYEKYVNIETPTHLPDWSSNYGPYQASLIIKLKYKKKEVYPMMYSSSSCTSQKFLFPFRNGMKLHEPEFVNLFKEPRNRFPTWRPGATTLFDVPARQAT